MGMTADEAAQAAALGSATSLRRNDIGRLAVGACADAIVLDAASPIDFLYRPGVPLVRATYVGGPRA